MAPPTLLGPPLSAFSLIKFFITKLCFMKYIIGLVGILLSALSVNAQELPLGKIVSGRVLSASNDLPVEGATLTLLHQKKTVYTDASGIFSITLASSNDVLTVSHIGFLSKKISISQNT